MKPGQKPWTEEELILTMNLYCKLPFGRLHQGRPEVKELSQLIGRTPGSVAYKLVNLASLDPSLQARGIKGAANASKLDRKVWNNFYENWDVLPFESEKLLARFKNQNIEETIHAETIPEGETRLAQVKVRVNQSFFRSMIMASYNFTCCITGLQQPELLIAGHIKPWHADKKNRLNPQNGIAINALHDKAFETGLLTITPDYIIKISSQLMQKQSEPSIAKYFIPYHNQKINEPNRFLPNREFFEWHNKMILRS
jgi:putative restriction endonuclease